MKISTKRLSIQTLSEADAEDMIVLLTNDTIKKTFMIPDFRTNEEALAMFQKLLSSSHSEQHFVVGIYLNDKLIGFLNDVEIGEVNIELGYVIHPDQHGKGYATEALKAVINYLFQQGYQEILTGAFEENIASIKVMKKCGMVQIKKTEEIEYHKVVHHCVYYSIRRSSEE